MNKGRIKAKAKTKAAAGRKTNAKAETAPIEDEFDVASVPDFANAMADSVQVDESLPDLDDASNVTSAGVDPIARMTTALESLLARQEQTGNNQQIAEAIALLAQSLTALTGTHMAGSRLIADATKKAQRPSNEVAVPQISVFNLRGEKDFPRPKLKCEMLLPWPADYDSMTREEVELLNLLDKGEFTIMRADRTKIKLEVRVITKLDSDEPSRIVINHDTAFNNDYHRLMPHDWIRQIVTTNPKTRALANAVLTMDEEEALILAGKLNNGLPPAEGQSVISLGE